MRAFILFAKFSGTYIYSVLHLRRLEHVIFCAIWIFSGNGARGSLNGKSKKKRIFIIANIFFVISRFFYNRKIGFSNMYKVQGGLNVWRIEYPIHELLHSCKQHFTWWIDRFATSLVTTTSVQQHTDIWNLLLNIATIYSLFPLWVIQKIYGHFSLLQGTYKNM